MINDPANGNSYTKAYKPTKRVFVYFYLTLGKLWSHFKECNAFIAFVQLE